MELNNVQHRLWNPANSSGVPMPSREDPGTPSVAAALVWRECLRLPGVLMASGVLVHRGLSRQHVPLPGPPPWLVCLLQQIGFTHMRIGDGVNSRLQLSGLLADLCKLTLRSQA